MKAYFEVQNCSVEVVSSDKVTLNDIEKTENLEGIIFSPGPMRPENYKNSVAILLASSKQLPVFGVCLGHQLIAYAFGAKIVKRRLPMHGKVTRINHNHTGVFDGLPDGFFVTRYHSLTVDEDSLPDCLQIDARAEDGAIMALSHKAWPIFGVQFHPEAHLSQYGFDMIGKFVHVCSDRVVL